MKIDVTKLDRERFHVNERTLPGLGDFLLVVPFKAMWDWADTELALRSLLCRPDGTVVSAGFPKFFNFGERPSHDLITTRGLAEGRTCFYEKVDGSLIIRSIIDGKVHFRTRGSELIAEDMREDVERLIRDKYKLLLDPTYGVPQQSLLLEYISPKNQIVVKYEEADLKRLGNVSFSGDSLVVGHEGGSAYNLPHTVHEFTMPSDPVRLKETIASYSDREGIVTWTIVPHPERCGASAMHLSKFKSAWYLRLHALRSQATPRYLREFCYFHKIRSVDELKQAFLDVGFDWEVVSYVQPMFDEFKSNVENVERRLAAHEDFVQHLKTLKERKDIAIAARAFTEMLAAPELFGYLLHSALGEEQKAEEIRDAMMLEISVTQLRNLKKTGPEKLGSGKAVDDA